MIAHPLPQDYQEPIECPIESLEDFLALLGGKCAAFITQQGPEDPFRVRINTYAFEELGPKLELADRFKHILEQQFRRKIYENPDIIINENNYFMIIYMHPADGYRVVAQRESNGSYIFGALASPNYRKRICA